MHDMIRDSIDWKGRVPDNRWSTQSYILIYSRVKRRALEKSLDQLWHPRKRNLFLDTLQSNTRDRQSSWKARQYFFIKIYLFIFLLCIFVILLTISSFLFCILFFLFLSVFVVDVFNLLTFFLLHFLVFIVFPYLFFSFFLCFFWR